MGASWRRDPSPGRLGRTISTGFACQHYRRARMGFGTQVLTVPTNQILNPFGTVVNIASSESIPLSGWKVLREHPGFCLTEKRKRIASSNSLATQYIRFDRCIHLQGHKTGTASRATVYSKIYDERMFLSYLGICRYSSNCPEIVLFDLRRLMRFLH